MIKTIFDFVFTMTDAMLAGFGITWVWIKLVEKPIIYHKPNTLTGKKFRIFLACVVAYFGGKLVLMSYTQWGIWKKLFFVLGGHNL